MDGVGRRDGSGLVVTGDACPLVVDLDGTLLRTDLLLETLLAYVRPNPFRLAWVVWWLLHGRARLKHELALASGIAGADLPANDDVVRLASQAAAAGRPVFLATASDRLAADRVAACFPFIAGVIASENGHNLKGAAKADELQRRFPGGFDYAGDSAADLPVWRRARRSILVGASRRVWRAAERDAKVSLTIPGGSWPLELAREMRPRQWVKSLLIFVPLVLGGKAGDPGALLATVTCFLAACLVASSTYIINDLWDLADDRAHWSKRNRPLASGRLPISVAMLAAPPMAAAGLVLAVLVSKAATLMLLLYLVGTLAYSFRLKRVPLLDGLVLAGLFTTRLGLGIAASGVSASPWLLVFSMFLFASLGFAKRHTEIVRAVAAHASSARRRGYRPADAPLLLALGVTAGLGAVLIMVLYIIEDASAQTFYRQHGWLWGFPPLLFLLVTRIWLMCGRGELDDDPIEFVLRDAVSLLLGGAMVVCFLLAWIAALPS